MITVDPAGFPTLGFVGTGVVGTALAEVFSERGYRVVAVFNRRRDRGEALVLRLSGTRFAASPQEVVDQADIVFLTVSDDAIVSVAEGIRWRPGNTAIHCNGAASIELLTTVQAQGAAVGALHPLQSFASVSQARKNLPGSAFAIDASSDEVARQLTKMVRSLGGVPLSVQGSRVLYHASAVIASNYLVTLLDMASGLWSYLGLSKEEGLRALLPLVRGTVENLETLGLPAALTGPIARGDIGTIIRHLEALRDVAPEMLPVYKELARRAAPIATRKGTLEPSAAQRLSEILNEERGGNES